MRIGIAFDLKEDFDVPPNRKDLLEEYDSIETVQAIRSEIEQLGHDTVLLHGGKKFLEKILKTPVDMVFNIAEGRGGRCREAQVPAVCEMLQIPFTHSDALTLSLSLDKHMTIKLAKSAGIPVPHQFVISSRSELYGCNNFPFPAILKPRYEGSSMGITRRSLVKTTDELEKEALKLLSLYKQPVIVEEFLPGKELTVGIMGNEPPKILGVMEIAPVSGNTENFVYSIETKRNYRKLVSYACPPTGISENALISAGMIATQIYNLIDCKDIARVDLRLDSSGQPRLLEINPLPGLSPVYSDLCIMASILNISYSSIIEGILNSAFKRYGLKYDSNQKSRKKRQKVSLPPRAEFKRLQ